MRLPPNQLLSALSIPRVAAFVDPDTGHDQRWLVELDFEWAQTRVLLDGTAGASARERGALLALGGRLPHAAPVLVGALPPRMPPWCEPWGVTERVNVAPNNHHGLRSAVHKLGTPPVVVIVSGLDESFVASPEAIAILRDSDPSVRPLIVAPRALPPELLAELARSNGGYAVIEERPTRSYYATALCDVAVELVALGEAELGSPARLALPVLRSTGDVLVVDAIAPRPAAPSFQVHVCGSPIDLPVRCGALFTAWRERAQAPSEALVARVRTPAQRVLPAVEIVDPTPVPGTLLLRLPGGPSSSHPLVAELRIGDLQLRCDHGRITASAITARAITASAITASAITPAGAGLLCNGIALARERAIGPTDLVELGDVQLTVTRA